MKYVCRKRGRICLFLDHPIPVVWTKWRWGFFKNSIWNKKNHRLIVIENRPNQSEPQTHHRPIPISCGKAVTTTTQNQNYEYSKFTFERWMFCLSHYSFPVSEELFYFFPKFWMDNWCTISHVMRSLSKIETCRGNYNIL